MFTWHLSACTVPQVSISSLCCWMHWKLEDNSAVLPQQISLLQWYYCELGPHPHGTTVKLVPIPAVLPWTLSPSQRSNRGYCGKTVIPIPMQLSTTHIRLPQQICILHVHILSSQSCILVGQWPSCWRLDFTVSNLTGHQTHHCHLRLLNSCHNATVIVIHSRFIGKYRSEREKEQTT